MSSSLNNITLLRTKKLHYIIRFFFFSIFFKKDFNLFFTFFDKKLAKYSQSIVYSSTRDTFLLNFYIMTLPLGYVGQKVLRDICLEAQLNEEECDDYVGMVFR